MKEYYIDCRELTEEQVSEVCKELERLGYVKEEWCGKTTVIAYGSGIYESYSKPYNMLIVGEKITLEELKAL